MSAVEKVIWSAISGKLCTQKRVDRKLVSGSLASCILKLFKHQICIF